ncbi:DUF262 domain-containing protein [Desulfitobacterium metallireducens]|uniref:GmrSD restriction endonucleases N-terminal domain-containing protein n=1 Tax=Desulfitobacterium metallireducens DSM 15288 TaxID=871968 RepID=W0ECD1_9FIRM|nr:DUF262 domain-containing protein [Desulfitobacterium metallireducens]AHF08427.1 hypothetical protein DESME_02515 [Desulfitobacterium metallireducens DSM 15288]
MPELELLGIIAPLRKLLSNTNETINVHVDGSMQDILSLRENREYIIPDFQREIRWEKENLSQLVDDIKSGPKYLGNIILTQKLNENKFLIIDGQQRITVLTLILSCLNYFHNGQIDTISPCKLSIESFLGFEAILEGNFPDKDSLAAEIVQSDKLHQIDKYYELWSQIKVLDCIANGHAAKDFIRNLGKSDVNIILNRSDDARDGIRYFIDVNLKGKQLDTEDIFKGYLFRNDHNEDIRNEWYKFKTNVCRIEATKKMDYPLLKLLEHYFYCDLYTNSKFRGLEFGEDFLLKNEFKTHEDFPVKFRGQTHLIEVINDNAYMLSSLQKLNNVIEIMLNVVENDSINATFTALFRCISPDRIDTNELKIIHNFMGKVLKDNKVLPKALVMKYILTVLHNHENKAKEEFRKIYGTYLLSVLFIIFENKKSKDVFIGVLKASNDNWYAEIITQIKSYFEPNKITDSKILAQYKLGTNEDVEDYKFRCKSLATIYNFFKIENEKVIISESLESVKRFLGDQFTTEHFIISDNQQRRMKVICGEHEHRYEHSKEFFSKYVNNLFNFIFISRELNESLSNYWLPQKMYLINNPDILECNYSKMVLGELLEISDSMQDDVAAGNFKDKLDLFFSRDFKEKYITYARNVLSKVIEKIKSE